MARICELTGKRPMKGSIIWRSGKSKKSGGIGTHITAITKRRFFPNLQRVKALVNGEVRYIRVAASALKKGLVVKAPKRTWKKDKAARGEGWLVHRCVCDGRRSAAPMRLQHPPAARTSKFRAL